MKKPYRALAVCGPTASGKSALGVYLAQRLGGEVLNVDSVQVYQGLNIGSAKISTSERHGISHHLLDIFTPDHPGTVAQFRDAALSVLGDLSGRGKLPILVGGSGMYLTVLLHGLAQVPATPDDVRESVGKMSSEQMYIELEERDPETAKRLNRNDLQRISRALEILRTTGEKPSDITAQHRFADLDVAALVIVLCHPREELYRRIDERSAQMVSSGLVQETQTILDTYGDVPALSTIGYKQARDYLMGRCDESGLVQEIAMHTRRFAKRQMTYWRNEPLKRGWHIRPTTEERAEEVAGFESFPERAQRRMRGFRAFHYSRGELLRAIEARLKAPLERSEAWYVWEDTG